MDYVEGEDLSQILARQGALPEAQALNWTRQVLDALEYLHSQGVVHRDVKPANVKITPQGQVFLVDFGLAKVGDPLIETTIGARGVTPGFAPLEQYGQGRTDARSDVYAVGATLYALLTGRTPPDAPKLVIGEESLIPPRKLNPRVSPGVESNRHLPAADPHPNARRTHTHTGHRAVADDRVSDPHTDFCAHQDARAHHPHGLAPHRRQFRRHLGSPQGWPGHGLRPSGRFLDGQ